LLIRVRPYLGHLSAEQVIGLCDIAQRFGNGIINLTSRANLQIRGVAEDAHADLLEVLTKLDVLDADPMLETKRTIVCTPDWTKGDLTDRMHTALIHRLGDLPELPGKMGIAIDTGPRPILQSVPADFRFERTADGTLILRADGAPKGQVIREATAIDALITLAAWFCDTGGRDAGRMARHLRNTPLPADWTHIAPQSNGPAIAPGQTPNGFAYGAPFGTVDASALRALIMANNATGLRVTPWRVFILEGAQPQDRGSDFITDPNDPLRQIHACPGATRCEQALQPTHALARTLAQTLPNKTYLHISGCAKGCAHRNATDITLVGTERGYDLVRNGTAWDEPTRRGLTPDEILKDFAG